MTNRTPYVPGFLLNDIVRYWRTVAVDFAAKRRERRGEKWALKRLKLRLSRKLIFAAGLSTCVSCKLCPSSQLSSTFDAHSDLCLAMVEHLLRFANRTPLETLAQAFLEYGAEEAGGTSFRAYDEFLGLLSDESTRKKLEQLSPEEASHSPLFEKTNEIAKSFQDGLSKLFFETDRELTDDVQRFGVF